MYEKTEHRDVNDFAVTINNALIFVAALVGMGVVYWQLGTIATQFYVVIVLVLAVVKVVFGWVTTLIRILGKFGIDNASIQADNNAAAAKPATELVKLATELAKGSNANTKADNDMQAILVKGLLANGFLDKIGPEFAQQFSVLGSASNRQIEQDDEYYEDDDENVIEVG